MKATVTQPNKPNTHFTIHSEEETADSLRMQGDYVSGLLRNGKLRGFSELWSAAHHAHGIAGSRSSSNAGSRPASPGSGLADYPILGLQAALEAHLDNPAPAADWQVATTDRDSVIRATLHGPLQDGRLVPVGVWRCAYRDAARETLIDVEHQTVPLSAEVKRHLDHLIERTLTSAHRDEILLHAYSAYWWMLGAGTDLESTANKAEFVLRGLLAARDIRLPEPHAPFPAHRYASTRDMQGWLDIAPDIFGLAYQAYRRVGLTDLLTTLESSPPGLVGILTLRDERSLDGFARRLLAHPRHPDTLMNGIADLALEIRAIDRYLEKATRLTNASAWRYGNWGSQARALRGQFTQAEHRLRNVLAAAIQDAPPLELPAPEDESLVAPRPIQVSDLVAAKDHHRRLADLLEEIEALRCGIHRGPNRVGQDSVGQLEMVQHEIGLLLPDAMDAHVALDRSQRRAQQRAAALEDHTQSLKHTLGITLAMSRASEQAPHSPAVQLVATHLESRLSHVQDAAQTSQTRAAFTREVARDARRQFAAILQHVEDVRQQMNALRDRVF